MRIDEEALLAALRENPHDVSLRLVYADWLEDHGDARAEEVRAKCRFRLPFSTDELAHVAAIATARRKADEAIVHVAAGESSAIALSRQPLLGGSSWNDFYVDDLRRLSRSAIAKNFPRDDRGRLELDCTVLLHRYEAQERLDRLHHPCLIAQGPKLRRDAQIVEVRLAPLIVENQSHNWEQLRWWWTEEESCSNDFARWGISGQDLLSVTGPQAKERVRELELLHGGGELSEIERIMLCTAWQDAGRFEDALRVCDIEFPPELSRMLDADEFKLYDGCCEPGNADSAAARGAKLRRALWQAAPWRWQRAAHQAQAELDAWRRAKRGRPRKLPCLRFFILPGSSHHSRKPGLMLELSAHGKARLTFVYTASNVTLARSSWERPIELDIARFGYPM